MLAKTQYVGCFLGLAIGDAYGAPYEGGLLERLLWRMIGTTSKGKLRYTDDTQMSIDLARSFLENHGIHQAHLAQTFAQSYRWSRGYGPSAGRLLKKIRGGAHWYDVNRLKYKEGSLGNGAAMRAPIMALCYPNDYQALAKHLVLASEITHAHPLAIEGAQLIAFVTVCALNDVPAADIAEGLLAQCQSDVYKAKVQQCLLLLQQSDTVAMRKVAATLGNGMTATESCVTAVYFALKYLDCCFDDLIRSVLHIKGDVDTIAAMACAIWGAANGDAELLPLSANLEHADIIVKLAEQMYAESV